MSNFNLIIGLMVVGLVKVCEFVVDMYRRLK